MWAHKLTNGVEIPIIGMGTYPLKGESLTAAILAAVKCGYRLFDTAHSYKNEESLGLSLSKVYQELGLSRSDFILETKVGEENRQGIPDGKLFYRTYPGEIRPVVEIIKSQVDNSLRCLKTDYLDIVLIHFPYPDFLNDMWRALETLHKEGKIKTIGVSNFRERHLKRIFSQCEIKPMINQVEISPLNTKESLVKFCHEENIQIEVYSPLMSLKRKTIRDNKLLKNICEKYQCSLAQLILRWNIERGLLPIAKSSSPSRLQENMNISFSISSEDVAQISSLNENYQYLPESVYCPGY